MSFQIAFWFAMALLLFASIYCHWPFAANRSSAGCVIILYIILILLGWHCFGPVIHQ
jgi:hypothetical protein